MLRVLLYSPAMQAIEMASEAFPIVRPQPKLIDDAPRMAPAVIPANLPKTAASGSAYRPM